VGVEVRPARLEDFLAFVGEAPPVRVKAYALLEDESVAAVGGVAFWPNGIVRGFLDIKDDAIRSRYPVSLFKAAKKLLGEVKAMGAPRIVAVPQEGVEAAERFLLRLGFVPVEGSRFYAID
jgi:hypothetical protein